MLLQFLFFYSEMVYSVSFIFLSFYCHSRFHFRFHPLLPILLFRHCFLPQISHFCLFLFSFWAEVAFHRFHHNRSCNKLQVRFLSSFLSSDDIFLLLVFMVAYHIHAVFRALLFFSLAVRILVDRTLVVLTYPCA